MTAVDCPVSATELKQIKADASELLEDFDEGVLRNTLIRAAGQKLSSVADTSSHAIGDQIQAMRQNVSGFDSILERMKVVQANVQQMDANVETVVHETEGSSQELGRVSESMRLLEEKFTAIDGLVKVVNEIAEQTHLLSFNATIEAARAGDAGRCFAVVANEVKELATTTKDANDEIRDTLNSISGAVSTLSASVKQCMEKMQQSIEAVEMTRSSASTIGVETAQFSQQLESSRNSFSELDQSSVTVENEVQEMNTIGKTFSYLLELMAKQVTDSDSLDPLERLRPVVEHSTFHAPHRFSQFETEYVLQPNDILISATDTRGVITFANNCFYNIAEYEAGELVGQPHNVIRHPDMPKTAFADLWATIKDGKLWQGYVANLSRTGKVYWVKANVFPCFEQDEIVGYISIRTPPERSVVQQSIDAYRKLP